MSETVFIIFLLIVGIGQLILAMYLLGISAKVKSLLWLARTTSNTNSNNVLKRAYAKAKAVLTQAELSGIKITAESKIEQQKYASKLEKEMAQQCDKAMIQYQSFLLSLRTRSEDEMSDYTNTFKKEIKTVVEAETMEMKKALAAYKAAKMAEMDANFAAAAQKAIELILQKKISLADEVDLVNEALEKAKGEKLIS